MGGGHKRFGKRIDPQYVQVIQTVDSAAGGYSVGSQEFDSSLKGGELYEGATVTTVNNDNQHEVLSGQRKRLLSVNTDTLSSMRDRTQHAPDRRTMASEERARYQEC